MNGVTHPGHWAAIQHYDQVAHDMQTAERYEIERMLRTADETLREERRAQRRAERAERRSQRQRLIRCKVQRALRLSL